MTVKGRVLSSQDKQRSVGVAREYKRHGLIGLTASESEDGVLTTVEVELTNGEAELVRALLHEAVRQNEYDGQHVACTGSSNVLQAVAAERLNQDEKWGEQNHNAYKWLAILGEEVGEANKAGLEMICGEDPDMLNDLRLELVQVAAVAVAFIESLDRNGYDVAAANKVHVAPATKDEARRAYVFGLHDTDVRFRCASCSHCQRERPVSLSGVCVELDICIENVHASTCPLQTHNKVEGTP